MIVPQPSLNEDQRLAALHALHILDTPPEERFDRITRLATDLFAVPIAYISLVDGHRLWFKSRQGLPSTETSRDDSFCTHAILTPDRSLVVTDATRDERFHDSPHVTGELNARFYAGYPLLSPEGHALGTLCIIDHESHSFDDKQRGALRDLAKMAEAELNTAELNLALGALRKAEENYRGIFENVAEGIFQIDPEGRYTNANPAAARHLRLRGHGGIRGGRARVRGARSRSIPRAGEKCSVSCIGTDASPISRARFTAATAQPLGSAKASMPSATLLANACTTRVRSTTSPRRNTRRRLRPRRAMKRCKPPRSRAISSRP